MKRFFQIKFTRTFDKNHMLKGLVVEDSLDFPTLTSAEDWKKNVENRNIKELFGRGTFRIVCQDIALVDS